MKKAALYLGLISLLLTGLLAAQPGPPHHRMAAMLGLTQEQQTQVQKLRLDLQKELIPLRSEIRKLRGELKLVMTADNFDQGQMEKLVNKMSDLRAQIQKKRMLHHRAVRSLLTDEQKQKFDLHFLSRAGFKGRQGMGPGCGPGWGGPPANPDAPHPFRRGWDK